MQVLQGNVEALVDGTELPFRGRGGSTSSVNPKSAMPSRVAGPRSHS